MKKKKPPIWILFGLRIIQFEDHTRDQDIYSHQIGQEVLSLWLWFNVDRLCSYWLTAEHSSISLSSARFSIYLSISLSLRIVLMRSVDRAMHYSFVSFMSLQSWALTKGEQSRNTINQAHSPQWDTLIGCHRISKWTEKCCRAVCVHRDWLEASSAPQPKKKLLKPPCLGRGAPWFQPGFGWPTIANALRPVSLLGSYLLKSSEWPHHVSLDATYVKFMLILLKKTAEVLA